ncbi:MAG: hypothetical protein EXX96DRAFT_556453 [Benjaminiella poitrasii]|nr:MAG: hypothetical protein EXX96DRAFT_556453 [Benjaminiella poitrasii]
MPTFFENQYYFSAEVENIQVKEERTTEQSLDVNDFFVTYDHTIPSFKKDTDGWKGVVSNIRQQIFNSTSTTIPSPELHLFKKEEYSKLTKHNVCNFRFNNDPFASSEPLVYRKQRSENLVLRMIHCKHMDMNQISLMRLSKGVFVHQKWKPCPFQASPTLSAIEETLNNESIDSQAEAPVNTFQFNNVLCMSNGFTSSSYETFIPYSYTFGASYTNPYKQVRDLVVRGKIPLWCQTLFLSTCLKQDEPILPYVTITGLFIFAPQVAVTFKPLIEDETNAIKPELALVYERFTLEHTGPPSSINLEEYEHFDTDWPDRKKEVLKNMLVCNIPDDLAEALHDAATVWAASQGLLIS